MWYIVLKKKLLSSVGGVIVPLPTQLPTTTPCGPLLTVVCFPTTSYSRALLFASSSMTDVFLVCFCHGQNQLVHRLEMRENCQKIIKACCLHTRRCSKRADVCAHRNHSPTQINHNVYGCSTVLYTQLHINCIYFMQQHHIPSAGFILDL